MNLPNKLTTARICIIPVIIVISLISKLNEITAQGVSLQDLLLLILFAIASLTDFFDGKIARKHNTVTNFGKFMDPLADKLLVTTTLIILLEKGKFQVFGFGLGFVITIIIARELAITCLRTIAASNNIIMAASQLGKYKTASQMIMIIFLLIDCFPFSLIGNKARDITALVLISVATLLTVVSGIDYFIKNGHVLKTKQ